MVGRSFLLAVLALSLAERAVAADAAADMLARSLNAYHTLRSYSDSGEVLSEYRGVGAGATSTTKDSFTTSFQAPRAYVFQFTKDGGERYVIWTVDGETHDWWSATHVHSVHRVGPAQAFALGSTPTRGSSMMLPPVLFPHAQLHGPLTDIQELSLGKDETVDGHACYTIKGKEKAGFGQDLRPITVWIDHDTLLVRRILEDTPESSPQGSISRLTTTLKPAANPTLQAGSLFFDPPK